MSLGSLPGSLAPRLNSSVSTLSPPAKSRAVLVLEGGVSHVQQPPLQSRVPALDTGAETLPLTTVWKSAPPASDCTAPSWQAAGQVPPSFPCQDMQPSTQSTQMQGHFQSSSLLGPDPVSAESSLVFHKASAPPAMPFAGQRGADTVRSSTEPLLTFQVLEERIEMERALWGTSFQEFQDASSLFIGDMVTKTVALVCEDRLSCLESHVRSCKDELQARQREADCQQAVLTGLAAGTMDRCATVTAEHSSDFTDILAALREIYNDLEAIRLQHRQTLHLTSEQREAQGKLEDEVDSIRSTFNDVVVNIAAVRQQIDDVHSESLALHSKKASVANVPLGQAFPAVCVDASSSEVFSSRTQFPEADRRVRDLDLRNEVQQLLNVERAARLELQQATEASVMTCARAVQAERDARLRAVADLSSELQARKRNETAVDDRLRRVEGSFATEGVEHIGHVKHFQVDASQTSLRGRSEASTTSDAASALAGYSIAGALAGGGSLSQDLLGLASALDAEVAKRCLDVADLRYHLATEVAGVVQTLELRSEEHADALKAEREDRTRDVAELRSGLHDALLRDRTGEEDNSSHWSSLGFFTS